jgi:DDE superfamily endonuclease
MLDHESRSGVHQKKERRDRLIALTDQHTDWLLGFQDETWWGRVARPGLSSWAADGQPVRLVEQAVPRDDPAPKALACYGMWVPERSETWLRCVDGRPVSALTEQFLGWCAAQAAGLGMTTVVLIWDNAGWHVSRQVRAWLRQHNQAVLRAGQGTRLVPCFLPSRSPWLNPIEPKWGHAKRRVVEPDRLLDLIELEDRICDALGCPRYDHLAIPNPVD